MANFRGTQRIEKRFKDLKKARRTGLVAFITAGDPNKEISSKILKELPNSGADIIEIGMPFSDPMADGPAIQTSSQRALNGGNSMLDTLEMVSNFRKINTETPIILMGYFNPIYAYGTEKFVIDAASAGVDGFIVVDLPPEEAEMLEPVRKAGLSFIYLITPTTNNQRIPLITEQASGFIYYVSVTGVTGTKSAPSDEIANAVKKIRGYTDLPIAVGFGINTKEKAREISKNADAVVVGSAFIDKISENLNKDGKIKDSCVGAVLSLVQDIAGGLK